MSDEVQQGADADASHVNPIYGRRLRYPRAEAGLEFARVANFTDAVYAIALTLIAVELKPPILDAEALADPGHEGAEQLWELLGEMSGEITIFFIAFAVMGAYWFQNHRFMSGLRGVDTPFVITMLPYLAFIAFLPFPAATMGRYEGNTVAVSTFAVTMAAVSFVECLLLWRAHTADLFTVRLTREQYTWSFIGSMSPVVIFLASVPVMLLTGSVLIGFAIWALNVPTGFILNRLGPDPEADVVVAD